MSQKHNKGPRNTPSIQLSVVSRTAGLNAVAAAVAGILYCAGGAYAADETPAVSDESNALNEIVVTASAQGVKKLDASYNIVSLSLDDIKNSNPASVAD